jgi:hypothetical protein
MCEHLPQLEYHSTRPEPRSFVVPLCAVLGGAVIGFVVAELTFESVVRFLARGSQLVVLEASEPFRVHATYVMAMICSGAIVGASTLAGRRFMSRRLRRAWPLIPTTAYACGALCAIAYLNEVGVAPTGWPGPRLSDVPILAPPATGCALTLVTLLFPLFNRRQP